MTLHYVKNKAIFHLNLEFDIFLIQLNSLMFLILKKDNFEIFFKLMSKGALNKFGTRVCYRLFQLLLDTFHRQYSRLSYSFFRCCNCRNPHKQQKI